MIKYILIGLVILGVIAVAGYVVTSQPNTSPDQSNQESTPESPDTMMQDTSVSGTIFDLLARGTALECTFSASDEYGSTSGTVYIANDIVRGDFALESMQQGESYEKSMIRDDEYTYIWSSLEEQGTKIKNVDPEDVENAMQDIPIENEANKKQFSLENQEAGYSCKPWTVDQRMFTPPSDIKFVDLSAQMEEPSNTIKDHSGIDCSVCDQLPSGATQDQCRASFGC